MPQQENDKFMPPSVVKSFFALQRNDLFKLFVLSETLIRINALNEMSRNLTTNPSEHKEVLVFNNLLWNSIK